MLRATFAYMHSLIHAEDLFNDLQELSNQEENRGNSGRYSQFHVLDRIRCIYHVQCSSITIRANQKKSNISIHQKILNIQKTKMSVVSAMSNGSLNMFISTINRKKCELISILYLSALFPVNIKKKLSDKMFYNVWLIMTNQYSKSYNFALRKCQKCTLYLKKQSHTSFQKSSGHNVQSFN